MYRSLLLSTAFATLIAGSGPVQAGRGTARPAAKTQKAAPGKNASPAPARRTLQKPSGALLKRGSGDSAWLAMAGRSFAKPVPQYRRLKNGRVVPELQTIRVQKSKYGWTVHNDSVSLALPAGRELEAVTSLIEMNGIGPGQATRMASDALGRARVSGSRASAEVLFPAGETVEFPPVPPAPGAR